MEGAGGREDLHAVRDQSKLPFGGTHELHELSLVAHVQQLVALTEVQILEMRPIRIGGQRLVSCQQSEPGELPGETFGVLKATDLEDRQLKSANEVGVPVTGDTDSDVREVAIDGPEG